MRMLLLFFALLVSASSCLAQLPPGSLIPVRDGCGSGLCIGRHAIVFVHGIYGGADTFTNSEVSPSFSWPENVPTTLAGSPIDVYRIEYKTALLTWAKENIASLDQVIDAIYPPISRLRARKYDSVNFVAHSLGGNVVKAYLHSVKNEEGHIERAKHGFILTVGTPVNGASIANVGLLLKELLGMQDPLLSSLQRDNTFLRMMNLWARQEDAKATKFRCRQVHLYAGIESKPLGPIQVVDVASAQGALPSFAVSKVFPLNHSQIAKPRSIDDEPFVWFKTIAESEVRRINDWGADRRLCEKEM